MKTIGLLGGMSWESSAEYYRLINEETRSRLGGTHSAECVMYSFDFHRIEALQSAGDWETAQHELEAAARGLVAAGADLIVICTNTMHVMADAVAAAAGVPLIHIADAAADAALADGVGTLALLGTRYTMEGAFYTERLGERGLEVMVPDEPDRTMVHDVIYDELVRGLVEEASRSGFVAAIDRLARNGAQGVLLGCTEIELLIRPEDVDLPVYPTTALHAAAAVAAAFDD